MKKRIKRYWLSLIYLWKKYAKRRKCDWIDVKFEHFRSHRSFKFYFLDNLKICFRLWFKLIWLCLFIWLIAIRILYHFGILIVEILYSQLVKFQNYENKYITTKFNKDESKIGKTLFPIYLISLAYNKNHHSWEMNAMKTSICINANNNGDIMIIISRSIGPWVCL